jgi:hypothetical protein
LAITYPKALKIGDEAFFEIYFSQSSILYLVKKNGTSLCYHDGTHFQNQEQLETA